MPNYTFDDYQNCTLFDVHRWSDYPEVLAVRKQILEELGFSGSKKEINHVTVILLNLYYVYCLDPDMWVMFSRDRNDFNQGKRYNKLFIKYDIMIKTVDKLLELEYIEQKMGFNDPRPGGKAFAPKMKATTKLIDLIENKHAVTFNMIGKYVPDELIVLRDAVGEDIDYVDTKETNRMRAVLEAYNKLLSETYIDIHFDVADIQDKVDARRKKININTGLPKDYRLVINLSNKRVRRIFNNSTFNQGGRFYGGWFQNIPSKLREKIIINTDYTVEIDYSGLHIYLLYALKGINFADLDIEPYIYPKDNDPLEYRPILKVMLLAAINSKDEVKCIKAVQYEINMNRDAFPEELPDLKEAYQMFKEYHEDIADMFCSKLGTKLQKLDSTIAETVVNVFTSKGLPVLVVHDSFICAKENLDYLYEIMRYAYSIAAHKLGVPSAFINTKTVDITNKAPEPLREDNILIDYLAWLDKPQGRRFTNYLITEDPSTEACIKVFNTTITETGVCLEYLVPDEGDFS